VKNRISATLAKYGLGMDDYSDAYGVKARVTLEQRVTELPPQTQWVTTMLVHQLDFVQEQIGGQEQRLEQLLTVTPAMQRLVTLPGIGLILGATIALEIGDIGRFASAERLASYAGTTPRVMASGDKVRYGRLRSDVNHYLKWAFVEAANTVALHHRRRPQRHVSQLYQRLRARKGHAKAIGAVARHLAEAAFHVLSRQQAYRDPTLAAVDPAGCKREPLMSRTPPAR
jgi:transposase